MFKSTLRGLPVLLSVLLAVWVLAACAAPAVPAPTAAPSQSQATQAPAQATQAPAATQPAAQGDLPTLNYHFAASAFPNALKDQAEIEAAMNAILGPAIGANVALHPYGFTEAAQKINLILQSGEECDLISVGQFVPFVPAASSGGLLALDELLPQHAPNYYARFKPEWLDAARVDGKLYNAPNYNGWTSYAGFWARSDLIEKYKFDWKATKKWEDWEPLWDQVVANEEGVTPLMTSDFWGQFWFPTYYGYDPIDESIGSGRGGSLIGVKVGDDTRKVQLVLDTPEYRQALELANKWFDKGYMLKDIIPDSEAGARRSELKFAAFMFPATGDFSTKAMADTEWAGVPIYTQHLQPATILTTGIGRTGYTVCATSKHPDLAVKFIEEMNQNAELYNLINFGIEGKHWAWKDEANKVIEINPGKPLDQATWLPNAYWQFGDRRNLYLTDPTDIGVWDRIDEGIEAAEISPLMGFTFNPKPVEAEIAAVNTVAEEYEALTRGMTDDIDGKLAEYKAALQAAGIDKIIAEAQSQIDAWAKQ